ncbi:SAYSvFN domain-containing protein 1 [Frankliniella fusca]|uniref:SAYSvFN domain-containing protein 1 n=1 Tax=Frankliniella fusca TaxID=407009 RepID=A0AAE1L7P3_9NEOP|nr:SAYSvFN domain-containing protein 1 [Frankliniella fusca]
MEKKLQEYRARKRREAFLSSAKNSIASIMFGGSSASTPCSTPPSSPDRRGPIDGEEVLDSDDSTHHLLGPFGCDNIENGASDDEDDTGCASPPWLSITLYALYTLLWATLMGIAVQLEFGAVFFILSLLVLMWLNTRTKKKKPGEPSAYSVFNPNCEPIDGTIKPEQFEAELRYGTVAAH